MSRKLLRTDDDVALAMLRLMVGAIFFAHGAQQALGWFGGQGFSATMDMFENAMHIPAPLAFLAIMAELLGGLGLMVGLLGRIAAFAIFCTMIVAVLKVHIHNGLFMNWAGNQKGEGFEYHLLVLAITIVIMMRGSGALSIDRKVAGA